MSHLNIQSVQNKCNDNQHLQRQIRFDIVCKMNELLKIIQKNNMVSENICDVDHKMLKFQ